MTPSDAAPIDTGGASPAAIEAHYDLGNAFFGLWLDEAMVYTAALWDPDDPGEPLEAAQRRKIDALLGWAAPEGASGLAGKRVLDVGCGWGGLLARAVEAHGAAEAVGLTLSPSQRAYVEGLGRPGVAVRLEDWNDHRPASPYDAVVSVEAIEAFARLGLPPAEKLAVYRRFFERAHGWLAPGGRLVLQAITYGNSGPEDFDGFIASEIFPESDLPRLAELAEAWERRFEVEIIRNRRHDYARTLKAWRERLRARRPEAVAEVGEEVVVRFERYLRLSAHMFSHGTCDLLQLALRRIDAPRPRRAAPPLEPPA